MSQECPISQKLSAYHDGELDGDERAIVSGHVAICERCAGQLAQLRKMSEMVSASAVTHISQIALKRLHHKLDEVLERGLVRWAWEVSGIAAAIVLVGSVWLMHLRNSTELTAAADVPPWVDARVSADPVVQVAATPAAAWYLVDNRNTADIGP